MLQAMTQMMAMMMTMSMLKAPMLMAQRGFSPQRRRDTYSLTPKGVDTCEIIRPLMERARARGESISEVEYTLDEIMTIPGIAGRWSREGLELVLNKMAGEGLLRREL